MNQQVIASTRLDGNPSSSTAASNNGFTQNWNMKHRNALLLSLVLLWEPRIFGFAPSSITHNMKTSALLVWTKKQHSDHPVPLTSLLAQTTINNNADFEYQEMRAILMAMEKQKIQTLEPIKRAELESYITRVVYQRIPPIQSPLTVKNLVNTKYRLAFSNQTTATSDLPKDATVLLDFTSNSTLNYRLEFTEKTLGLQNLNAKCSYTLDEATGLMKYIYESITTDVFGFRNISVGLFGLLKGRTSYIVTAYFDGVYWIEVAYDSPEQTSTYTNVYVKSESRS